MESLRGNDNRLSLSQEIETNLTRKLSQESTRLGIESQSTNPLKLLRVHISVRDCNFFEGANRKLIMILILYAKFLSHSPISF